MTKLDMLDKMNQCKSLIEGASSIIEMIGMLDSAQASMTIGDKAKVSYLLQNTMGNVLEQLNEISSELQKEL